MATTNEEGRARFENIPGGVYVVKESDTVGFKAGIKNLRQDRITLYLNKQQKKYIFTKDNAVYLKK
jgi:sortase A